MDDSSAILSQISSLKDMLDQVNEEIEKNIQITRNIESEIVRCEEVESALAARESELTRAAYELQFEIFGLKSVTVDSINSVKPLKEELRGLKIKRDEIRKRMNRKRKGFISRCLEFQEFICKGENAGAVTSLMEKEFLENEINTFSKKNTALQNSMKAFVDEVLEDLQGCITALDVEVHCRKSENVKLLKDIDELKATLLSAMSSK